MNSIKEIVRFAQSEPQGTMFSLLYSPDSGFWQAAIECPRSMDMHVATDTCGCTYHQAPTLEQALDGLARKLGTL